MNKSDSIALIIPIHYEQNNVAHLLKNISIKIKVPVTLYFIYDNDTLFLDSTAMKC